MLHTYIISFSFSPIFLFPFARTAFIAVQQLDTTNPAANFRPASKQGRPLEAASASTVHM